MKKREGRDTYEEIHILMSMSISISTIYHVIYILPIGSYLLPIAHISIHIYIYSYSDLHILFTG